MFPGFIRRRSGQVKPVGMHRIDWGEPITRNLMFFGFDTGLGTLKNLVLRANQIVERQFTVQMQGPPGASPYGAGMSWQGINNSSIGNWTEVDVGPDRAITIATCLAGHSSGINSAPAGAGYTFACGHFQTSAVLPFGCTIYGRPNAAQEAPPPYDNWCFALGTNSYMPYCQINNNGNDAQIGSTFDPGGINVYQTLGCSIVNYTTGTLVSTGGGGTPSLANGQFFAQGNQIGSTVTGLIADTTNAVTPGGENQIMIGAIFHRDTGVSDFPYFGFVPWAAFWNRGLSQSEHMKMHTDPYHFLIRGSDLFGPSFL